ncbi:MAG: hypothetical protein P8L85_23935 [Rubripirellula sp.]|nr:hypothetical protein [Rubripirellula sp.]
MGTPKICLSAKRRVLFALLAFGLAGPLSADVVQLPAPPLDLDGGVIKSASGDQPVEATAQEEAVPQQAVPQQAVQDGKAILDDQPPVQLADPVEPVTDDPQSPVVPSPVEPPQLNTDPNAEIEDLVPPPVTQPPPTAPPAASRSRRQAGLGATAAGFSAAPTMIGDLFGGSFSTFGGSQTVSFSAYAPAHQVPLGNAGAANATLLFEFGSSTFPDDVTTQGLGFDVSGDTIADTFAIAEPIPPSDALVSPGPGFLFDGGTATYTDNTTNTTAQNGSYADLSTFLVEYSYTNSLSGDAAGNGRPLPGPGVATRRVKLSENFSPEVRDRCFMSYNFFNDAFANLGDISRYTLGVERQLVDRIFSVEARLVMAGTYASTQDLDQGESRDFELGNAALISKLALLRTERLLWSGGVGVTLPTADDSRFFQGNQELFRVENQSFHILPFTALLMKINRDTAMQAYLQLDVAANGDSIYGDLLGGPLPKLGVFTDSTLMTVDVAFSRTVYRSQQQSVVQQLIANAELHYTGTLQPSDFVTDGSLTYTNLKRNFNVVNATGGMHFVLNNDLVVTPAMSIPLRSGLDEQFDYEAIVQVNWLR